MSGAPWTEQEIIVAIDLYLEMLDLEESGTPYVKVHYARKGAESTGRSAKSMEFKFQNISAVLDELGLTYIDGFKPRKNYQQAVRVHLMQILRTSTRHQVSTPKATGSPNQ